MQREEPQGLSFECEPYRKCYFAPAAASLHSDLDLLAIPERFRKIRLDHNDPLLRTIAVSSPKPRLDRIGLPSNSTQGDCRDGSIDLNALQRPVASDNP